MNYPKRNTCRRDALMLALISLISAMMLPGLSLSRAAEVRTTPVRSQPAASSTVGMGAGVGATTIRRSLHGEVNSVTCFDPMPDPQRAGWTSEGNGSFQVSTPLNVSDPSNAPGDFINFFCSDASLFTGDIVLTPHFTIGSFGQAPASDGNTGIHVTINDGVKFARAFVVQIAAGTFKVALAIAGGGYSNGFPLVGSTGDFMLRRRLDGSATLSVANPTVGSPPLEETIQSVDLIDSRRQG